MAAQEPTSPHGGNKSGLAMFTHKMKESLGLAEKTTSNEQVRDLAKKLDTLAEHLKMLMKGVQKSTSSLRGTFFSFLGQREAEREKRETTKKKSEREERNGGRCFCFWPVPLKRRFSGFEPRKLTLIHCLFNRDGRGGSGA